MQLRTAQEVADCPRAMGVTSGRAVSAPEGLPDGSSLNDDDVSWCIGAAPCTRSRAKASAAPASPTPSAAGGSASTRPTLPASEIELEMEEGDDPIPVEHDVVDSGEAIAAPMPIIETPAPAAELLVPDGTATPAMEPPAPVADPVTATPPSTSAAKAAHSSRPTASTSSRPFPESRGSLETQYSDFTSDSWLLSETAKSNALSQEQSDHLHLRDILGPQTGPTVNSPSFSIGTAPDAVSEEENRHKGKGKSKKASELVLANIKTNSVIGPRTRGQRIREQLAEQRIRESTRKLLSTSREMVESASEQPSHAGPLGERTEKPIGDFSAEDLIRHNVAAPEVFDEHDDERTDEPTEETDERVPPTSREIADPYECTSTWTLGMFPYSYLFGRNNTNNAETNNAVANKAGPSTGRVESVMEEGCAPP